jgi:nucleotide-binding universal stress UspA family protein
MTYLEDEGQPDHLYPQGAVVVGYNGTAHSTAALGWAAAEATRREVALVVLYAADYPGMPMERGAGLTTRTSGAMEAAQEVTRRGVEEALSAHPELRVVAVTELTSPPRALTEASARAALVVLGSRGYGRVAGALLGSVAFAVASHAACPVVVVKEPDAERPIGADHPVVIGTDGSLEAAAALWVAGGHAAAQS